MPYSMNPYSLQPGDTTKAEMQTATVSHAPSSPYARCRLMWPPYCI